MKQYFISKGKMRQGPYQLEELLRKGITADTLVCYAGSNGWKHASDIEELKAKFPHTHTSHFHREKHVPEIAIVNNSEEDFSYWILKIFSMLLLLLFLVQVLQSMSNN